MSDGIRRICTLCHEQGVAESVIEVSEHWVTTTFPRSAAPDTQQVAPRDTPHVRKLVSILQGDLVHESLGLGDRTHLFNGYLKPAIEAGLVEMTIPDKPRSGNQKYRLTPRGRELLAELEEETK